MSQSTAPSLGGFVIAKDSDIDNLMEQSQIISKMMENSELTKQSRPNAFECNSSSNANASIPSQIAQELSQSRRELDAITQKVQSPASLSIRPQQHVPQSTLATVPELELLTLETNAVSPMVSPSNDLMTRSRLFQEFASKQQMQQARSGPLPYQRAYSEMPMYVQNPYDGYEQQMMRMQIGNQPMPMRSYSVAIPGQMPGSLPGQMPGYYPPPVFSQQTNIPRPQSYVSPSYQQPPVQHSPVQHQIQNTMARPSQHVPSQQVQFVPLCRYEDPQAIRAVSFHPSGRYFAIGTNSKNLLVCRYPNIKNIE